MDAILAHIIPKVVVTDLPEANLESPYWLINYQSLKFEVPFIGKMVDIQGTAGFLYGSILLYLLCVFLIFPLIKPQKTVTERIALYHFGTICVYSFIVFASGFYHVISTGQISNFASFLCTPVPAWLRLVSITFTLSKIWEWLDTAIFLWRQPQPWGDIRKIDFLHTYHHATTFFLFLHVTNLPGDEKAGMIWNGFVHTLMYYHYGFRLPKSFRPIITFAQIVQLASTTYWHSRYADTCPAFADYPEKHPFEYLVVYALVPVYLIFFIKFFIEEYIFKKEKKPASTSSTSVEVVKAKKQE